MTKRASVLSVLAILLLTTPLALVAAESPGVGPSPTAMGAPPASTPACGGESALIFTLSPTPMSNLCGSCSDSSCVGKEVGTPCFAHESIFCTITLPTCNTFTTRCTCQAV